MLCNGLKINVCVPVLYLCLLHLFEWSLGSFWFAGYDASSFVRSPLNLLMSNRPCGRTTAASGTELWLASSLANHIHGIRSAHGIELCFICLNFIFSVCACVRLYWPELWHTNTGWPRLQTTNLQSLANQDEVTGYVSFWFPPWWRGGEWWGRKCQTRNTGPLEASPEHTEKKQKLGFIISKIHHFILFTQKKLVNSDALEYQLKGPNVRPLLASSA